MLWCNRRSLATVLGLLLCPALALAQVRISEVLNDPIGSDDGSELIEIVNEGAAAVDLHFWALCLDNKKFGNEKYGYQFQTGRTLPAGAYLIIHWRASGVGDAGNVYTESEGSYLNNPASAPIDNEHFALSLFESDDAQFSGSDLLDPIQIRDFMQVGGALAYRESVAVAALIWTPYDEVLRRPEGFAIFHDGTGHASSDYFASPAGFHAGANGVATNPVFTYGAGCPGSGGFAPFIPPADRMPADAATRFQISLTQGLGQSVAYVTLGFQQTSLPFGHCTLLVLPYAIVGPAPLKNIGQGHGTLQLDASNPVPGMGVVVYLTFFCADPSMTVDATLSNAIALTL